MEPVAVVVCAALKCAGMIAVFIDSADDLYDGDTERRTAKHGWLHIWKHHRESVLLFALVSLVKLAFCTWCELVVRGGRGITTETARAVLVDNHNDLLLSVGALVANVDRMPIRLKALVLENAFAPPSVMLSAIGSSYKEQVLSQLYKVV